MKKEKLYLRVNSHGTYELYFSDDEDEDNYDLEIDDIFPMEYLVAVSSDGKAFCMNLEEILSKPKNKEIRIDGWDGSAIEDRELCDRNYIILLFSDAPDGSHWFKAVNMSYLLSDIYRHRPLLPPNYVLDRIQGMPEMHAPIFASITNNASSYAGVCYKDNEDLHRIIYKMGEANSK